MSPKRAHRVDVERWTPSGKLAMSSAVFEPLQLPRSLPAALRDVSNPKTWVRRSVLRDLVRHAEGERRDEVLRALEQRAIDDPIVNLRADALLALADSAATESLDVILRGADDNEPRVRQMAVVALGELAPAGHAVASSIIRQALVSTEAAMRYQALIAARRVVPAVLEKALETALSDEDLELRYLALRLLDESDFEQISESEKVTIAGRALNDEGHKVRVAAALILGRAGDSRAEAHLAGAIGGRDLEHDDVSAAISLCGAQGYKSAREALMKRAHTGFRLVPDPHGLDARVALAKLGDAGVISGILGDLSAWTRHARNMAVMAAGSAALAAAEGPLERMRNQPRRADPELVEEALASLKSAGTS